MNADRAASGVMLGPQLPQASTSASPSAAAVSTCAGAAASSVVTVTGPPPSAATSPAAPAATARPPERRADGVRLAQHALHRLGPGRVQSSDRRIAPRLPLPPTVRRAPL